MSQKVIAALNEARQRELTAIATYMVQHYEFENSGYGKLGDTIKDIAITEMKHAEKLGERILFLDGSPVTKPEGDISKGLGVLESLKVDVDLEIGAITLYNESAKLCAQENDHVSKALFQELLAEEEEHLDEFQTTIDHINQLGNAYLATLLG
jgi:bacterioferritin